MNTILLAFLPYIALRILFTVLPKTTGIKKGLVAINGRQPFSVVGLGHQFSHGYH